MTQLTNFLNSSVRNLWIKYEDLEIYVRKGPRFLENKRQMCFDISNINSKSPGRGSFGRFLISLILELKNTEYNIIFVENVLNPRFAISLVNHYNFKEVETFIDQTGPPCFYLRIAK